LAKNTWRIEIYLPKYYNPDLKGRRHRIEAETFDQTEGELFARFGALTRTGKVELPIISGVWQYEGVLYEDDIISFIIYTQPAQKTRRFLRRYKRTLEKRFQQVEVLIIVTEVEIIR